MVQALCSWMKTLGDVVASQSAKSLTSRRSEGGAADQRASRHRVAVLAGLRKLGLVGGRIGRAPGERADARAEVRAVAKRIQLDAEHRAGGERGPGDPLRSDRGGAGHL